MSLFDIQKVVFGSDTMTATVRLANGAPIMTDEDIEATNRVYQSMPQIAEHACISPAGDTLREVLGSTEVAHLLEHVTVELLARATGEGVSAGNTSLGDEERTWNITLSCPDDVVALACLSSACWIMEWAFAGGSGALPDVDGLAQGIAGLVSQRA